jgi:CRP-like cAMP-binding protein
VKYPDRHAEQPDPKGNAVLKRPIRTEDTQDPRTNRLLAALDPAEYATLAADAKVVSFKLKKRLYRLDDPIDAVYFPMNCMASVLSGTKDNLVETATIGREGVVGASELIQSQVAMGLHIIQLPGAALRVEASTFRKHLMDLPGLKNLVERHLYALMQQVLQSAACNRLHGMEERAARWLLMTHDRARVDTFPLTQEFLANMLAVRRATANVATGTLRKAGLIRYVRGKVTVVDREGLESAACECYTSVWRSYDRSGIQH